METAECLVSRQRAGQEFHGENIEELLAVWQRDKFIYKSQWRKLAAFVANRFESALTDDRYPDSFDQDSGDLMFELAKCLVRRHLSDATYLVCDKQHE